MSALLTLELFLLATLLPRTYCFLDRQCVLTIKLLEYEASLSFGMRVCEKPNSVMVET